MNTTTVQFGAYSIDFQSWFERLWMEHRPSTISPSIEREEAEKISKPIQKKFFLSVVGALIGLFLCLWNSPYSILQTPSLFWLIVGLSFLICFIAFAVFSLGQLAEVKTPTSDTYIKDLRELYLELNQNLDVDIQIFGEKYPTEAVLRADIETYLVKAAAQIDAKQAGKLFLDAEKERRQLNRLHAAALKFGLVRRTRSDYYPPFASD